METRNKFVEAVRASEGRNNLNDVKYSFEGTPNDTKKYSSRKRLGELIQDVDVSKTNRKTAISQAKTAVDEGYTQKSDIDNVSAAERDVADAQSQLTKSKCKAE